MHSILFIAVAFLPSIRAYVDCRIACRHCRENRIHPTLMEVHCAMCEECKSGRKRMLYARRMPTEVPTTPQYEVHEELMNYPQNCPNPPTCDSDDESAADKLNHMVSTTTTTTTTTETPCPPAVSCKTTTKDSPVPCMPLCMNPCPYQTPLMPDAVAPVPASATVFAPRPVIETISDTTSSDYYYVYIGIPKGIIKN